ncbi:4983_t:CDS:2 [Entrophospora sp. SA101]|nr:4983_t:CDS:2 [Entrophospora sp. SA101]
MGEEQAKNLLKEMISNFITQDKNYPQGLNLNNKAKFIGSVFGSRLEAGKKEEVIKETRTVLNGLVEAKVNEQASKDYDETNKRSKNPNTIRKLAGLYKLTAAKIDYQKMKNEEGKMNKINNEIGENYVQSPSKFSTLLNVFATAEIIGKSTNKEKREEIENNPQTLEGVKEIVEHFDKEQGEA